MMTNVKNNSLTHASIQTSSENNQFAFERFCEFCKEGYSIQVQLKSKKTDNASFHILVIKENDEREEIRLFLNQEILDLVLNYLESGKLGDTSKINPNDLKSFNERGVEFKLELFKAERAKNKEVVWSYAPFEKLASIHYNHGIITFCPYSYQAKGTKSIETKRKYPIVSPYLLEDSFSHKINRNRNKGVITPDFDSNCSPQSLSPSCTFATTKKENTQQAKNEFINPLKKEEMEIKKNEEYGNVQVNEKVSEVKTSSVEQSKSKTMNKGLKKSTGNMYGFVTHTWNPIIGKCEHECGYCYMSKMIRNQKPIRLEEARLKGDLGNGNFIFVGSGTDVFAENVPSEWITRVLDYCNQFESKYLFQSKNPERFIEFIEHPVFQKSVLCTTIESNRPYADCYAPSVEDRVSAIEMIKSETEIEVYVTIEPVMDFDLPEFVDLIKRCEPVQVNIGADSKGNKLPEPNKEKIENLITELSKFTKVERKKNLKRLMIDPKTLELAKAKKTASTSLEMTAQIMVRTANGYTIKEENRKFGLVKENRPIKDSDVNGFLQIIQGGRYKDSQSIITVEAVDIIENYNIVDLEGNAISKEDASEYLIVIDGQHRITAFSKLNAIRNQADQITIPNVHIEKDVTNIKEFLADINMVGHSWNMGDKLCVSAIATGSKLLAKVNELIKAKYTPTTATLICTGKRITPNQLKELIITGRTDMLPNEEESLRKANEFLTITTSIVGDEIKLLKKRFFINGFNSFVAARTEEEGFEALKMLTKSDFESVHEDNEFVEKLKEALLQKAA